jgi:hypothetical protein
MDAALTYAGRGWRVFPLAPAGKTPATRNGCKDATTDEKTITRWWQNGPLCNIGIATGDPGIDVLDVEGDRKPGGSGWEAFHLLKRCGLLGGASALVRTPSDGVHVYFRGTAQSNGSLGGHHIDFRGAGGYVVAAPSHVVTEHYSGDYEVIDQRDAAGTLDWRSVKNLLDRPKPPARPRGMPKADVGALANWVAKLPEGSRNNGLFWAGCRAAEDGGDTAVLITAAIVAGLPESEAAATIASASRKVRGA